MYGLATNERRDTAVASKTGDDLSVEIEAEEEAGSGSSSCMCSKY
jgi:hypothetical protein